MAGNIKISQDIRIRFFDGFATGHPVAEFRLNITTDEEYTMAVIVQYIVERNGIQKMTFDNKKEADAYDKELEISEEMSVLLEQANIAIDDKHMEELCLFIAKNKEQAMTILKGSKPKAEKSAKSASEKSNSGEKKTEDKKSVTESTSSNSVESNKSSGKAA